MRSYPDLQNDPFFHSGIPWLTCRESCLTRKRLFQIQSIEFWCNKIRAGSLQKVCPKASHFAACDENLSISLQIEYLIANNLHIHMQDGLRVTSCSAGALVLRPSVLSVVFLFAGSLISLRVLAAPADQFPAVPPSQGPLRTITTAHQAHGLTSAEAKRGYPIHLRGVVTYFDTDTGSGYGPFISMMPPEASSSKLPEARSSRCPLAQ